MYLAVTDTEIGCWVSPEPNMYAGVFDNGSGLMGYNVYAYCANNPVNFSDPQASLYSQHLLSVQLQEQ